MAIHDLHCVRDGGTLAVVWSWDRDGGTAEITVTRLLDGVRLAGRSVGPTAYRAALSSSRHGPVLEVPAVPVRVEVRDEDGAQSVELLEGRYRVEWRLVRRHIYRPKRVFSPRKLLETRTALLLSFPCREEVPGDLFYYVLSGSARGGRGYLPSVRPGRNEYGVALPPGAGLTLCCDPDKKELSRLFDLRHLPDVEEEEDTR